MNDDDLQRELEALTPAPGPGYWERIDRALAGIEAERPAVGEDPQATSSQDTGGTVVRLTDMNQRPDLNNRFGRGGLVLAAAASIIVLLLAVGGFTLLRDNPSTIDTTDEGPADTIASTPEDTEDTGDPEASDADGELDVDADDLEDAGTDPDGSDGSPTDAGADDSTAPVVTTHCFFEADTEFVAGEHAIRLVVRDDGTAVAVQRLVRPDGQASTTEATGFVLDESQRTFAMQAELGAGEIYTRVWTIRDGGLSTDIESFTPNGDCESVDRVLDGVAMPTPVVPDPSTIDPILDPGTYCWLGEEVIQGFYQLTVEADGTASSQAYRTVDSVSPLVDLIASGTGTFATANEIALSLDQWTSEGFTSDSVIYTISGDRLQPTIYPSFLAEPVDCDVLDQWRLPTEGLNIYQTEELSFEAGTTGTTVEGGFLRDELVIYQVEVDRGQTMTVTVSSVEDNAAFAIHTPDGLAIAENQDGSGSRSVVLPEAGVYDIVISSIRGNVSYTLDVEVV